MATNEFLRRKSPLTKEATWYFLRFMFNHTDAASWLANFDEHRAIQRWLFGPNVFKLSSEVLLTRCRKLYNQLQPQFGNRPAYSATVRGIGERLNLNETERRILWLAVLHFQVSGLRTAFCYFDEEYERQSEAAYVLARVVEAPLNEVMLAIGPNGHLVNIGLLDLRPNYHDLADYLAVSGRIAISVAQAVDADEALSSLLAPAQPSDLGPEDYAHLQNDLKHVSDYLRAALKKKAQGVNILIYGPPGGGKTSFAGVVARAVGVPLYVVPGQSADDFGSFSQCRLSAYRISQALLASTRAILLLDDAEDGILDWRYAEWSTKSTGKSWINGLLEQNPVPAIWITNEAHRFDSAHLRRYDLAIGFKTPPRSVRVSMIDKHLGRMSLSEQFMSGLADDPQLTPAQIGNVARVVGCTMTKRSRNGELEPLAAYTYRCGYRLRMGRDPDAVGTHPIRFEPELVNSSMAADQIVEMFRRAPRLTACFLGPPGTGKSALAEHVAQAIDQPLLVKRASDFLRPFVGETEMMIRQVFEQAADESALLLLDEADSFFAARAGAHYSWEKTMTNEWLTQLERFRGHFIATTNAFDVLDTASIRRFDLKVRFEALTLGQRRHMLSMMLAELGIESDAAGTDAALIAKTLVGLPQLTAGDFAVVARRFAVSEVTNSIADILAVLADEHSYKRRGSSIGFVVTD